MMTFGTRGHGIEPSGDANEAVVRRSSPRDTFESLVFLLGMFVILLGLAFTVGAPFPIGQ